MAAINRQGGGKLMGLLSRVVRHMGAGGIGAGAGFGAVAPEVIDPGRPEDEQWATIVAAALMGGVKGKALQGLIKSGIGKQIRGTVNAGAMRGMSDADYLKLLEAQHRRASDYGIKSVKNDLTFDIMDHKWPR